MQNLHSFATNEKRGRIFWQRTLSTYLTETLFGVVCQKPFPNARSMLEFKKKKKGILYARTTHNTSDQFCSAQGDIQVLRKSHMCCPPSLFELSSVFILFVCRLVFLSWDYEVHPMLGEKVACAAISLHLHKLCHTYNCSDTCHSDVVRCGWLGSKLVGAQNTN